MHKFKLEINQKQITQTHSNSHTYTYIHTYINYIICICLRQITQQKVEKKEWTCKININEHYYKFLEFDLNVTK